MIGYMAKSKAGHDKGKIYLILKQDRDYVYLANGDTKDTAHLKKKKRKHIQLIKKNVNPQLRNILIEETEIDNAKIKSEVDNVKGRCN